MSKRLSAPYDDTLTLEQNLVELVSTEIEATCPLELSTQRNPFIHMIAVKNLVFTNKLGVRIKIAADKTMAVSGYPAMRQLDMVLAADARFNASRVNARDFSKYLFEFLLPQSDTVVCLLRED